MCAQLPQSCLTFFDPKDCSLPGSSAHEILQARILEWVAISSSSVFSDPGIEITSLVSGTGKKVLYHFAVSSDAQSCPTLCDPMDCSTPGFPVHHQLPELAQTHVHRVSDAIQPSHPLSLPPTPSIYPSVANDP